MNMSTTLNTNTKNTSAITSTCTGMGKCVNAMIHSNLASTTSTEIEFSKAASKMEINVLK